PPAGSRYLLDCPVGWSYYKLSCFRYFRQLLSWQDAEVSPMGRTAGCPPAQGVPGAGAPALPRVSPQTHCQSSHSGAHLAWSQGWQWTNGDEYDDSSKLPGNGAQGGDCALLTQTSSFSTWSSSDCTRLHHFVCKFTP
ncbi:REG4 protein, partial [Anseranas semipalmata]|nr:REG4 protein [Anseranas semipalmata]